MGVSLSEEYTDNFDQSATKRENFRTTVSPAVTLDIDRALTRGVLGYTLSGAYDTVLDDFSFFHAFRGVLEWQVTPRLRLAAQDSFAVSDNAADADRLSLRQGREKFTSNLLTLDATYEAPTLTARPYYRLNTFTSDGDAGDDTTSHTIGASAGVTLANVNTVAIGYEYLLSDVDDDDEITGHGVTASVTRALSAYASAGLSGSYLSRDVAPGLGSDYEIATVSIFGSYVTSLAVGRLSATASIGYSILRDGLDDKSLPPFTLALSYELDRVRVSLVADQGYSETFAETANEGVVETRGVNASLSYLLALPVTATFVAFYRENDFTGIADPAQAGTSEEVIGVSLFVDVRLLSWLDLVLEYSYTDRNSRGNATDTEEYTENRVLLTLRATL